MDGSTVLPMLRTGALVVATVTTGLMAGLFYGYSCSVMPGLRRVDDEAFVATMRSINEAILHGWFAVCFGGALVFTLAAAATRLPAAERASLPWVVAGLTLYVATLALTGSRSIPLNNQLAAATRAPARLAREEFERSWVVWNRARTVTTVAAFLSLAMALSIE